LEKNRDGIMLAFIGLLLVLPLARRRLRPDPAISATP